MNQRDVQLLTWNVDRKDTALKLAVDHLTQAASSGTPTSWVAALQEVYIDKLSEATLRSLVDLRSLGRLQLVAYQEGGGKKRSAKCILATRDLTAIANKATTHPRFVGTTFADARGEWRDLAVACVHGISRSDARGRELSDRASNARDLRVAIEAFGLNKPLAILGDLQASPFEEELQHETGWFAFRERHELAKYRTSTSKPTRSPTGTKNPPRGLFNPMWALLEDANPFGTTRYIERGASVTARRWYHLDQILVTDELADQIGKPSIMHKLLAVDLTNKNGAPKISDHLPVNATLTIGGVKQCQISKTN